MIYSGQIIATSHDRFPPKGSVLEGKSSISGKSRLVNYYNLARYTVFFLDESKIDGHRNLAT